jgi:hypothetical protein
MYATDTGSVSRRPNGLSWRAKQGLGSGSLPRLAMSNFSRAERATVRSGPARLSRLGARPAQLVANSVITRDELCSPLPKELQDELQWQEEMAMKTMAIYYRMKR